MLETLFHYGSEKGHFHLRHITATYHYSAYAQVCVRLEHQLQTDREPLILLIWAAGVFRSILAVEILPQSLLHLKDLSASTTGLGDLVASL